MVKHLMGPVFEKSQQGTVVAIFAGLTVGSFSGHLFKLTYLYQTK